MIKEALLAANEFVAKIIEFIRVKMALQRKKIQEVTRQRMMGSIKP